MGTFYTNVSLRNTAAEAARAAMSALGRDAFVLQARDDAVVFDRETEAQDTEILAALAEHLATDLKTVSFAVLNHDDSILWFQLYSRSELVTEYANRGGPRTNVRALVSTLGSPQSHTRVWLALHLPFLFQVARHERLAKLLNLPAPSVGLGYTYIERGELPLGYTEAQIHRVRRGA